MSTELMEVQELSPEQAQTLQSKQSAWRELVEKMYRRELGLQIQAQNQIDKLSLPATVNDLVHAEAQLVEIKKAQGAIMVQRKELTGTFDKLTQRLMQPEKSLDVPIKQLNDAIILVKREHERKESLKREKDFEAQGIINAIKSLLAAKDHEYRSAISRQVSIAFQWALDNDVTPETVGTFIEKCSGKLGAADFQPERPDVKLKLVTPEEAEELFNEHFNCNPHAYAKIYQEELRNKFSDYEVAFANKATAKELAAKEEKERQATLKAEAEQKEVAAKMEAAATPLMNTSTGPVVKALKKVYELDMPDTMESVLKIFTAYFANITLAQPHVRVKNPLKGFSAESAGKAMAAVKNQDNAFQPSGINFKEVSKL